MKISFLKSLQTTLFFAIIFSLSQAIAQVKSFPGAEGAGATTTGGRGTLATPTTVYEVTNLNDDTNPGSFRYAVSTGTATYRTVVFRVSGTIHLNSKLSIKGNTTIAGQTAPGGGICLADHPVSIGGDNVILRYIRCRLGDKNQNKGKVDGSGGDDALGDLGHKNIIIDHCSVSWSSDEAFTVYRGDSVTLQWNIISEPLNYSYHFETGDTDFEYHAYGGIWGGRKASFHHNLFANMKSRTPRFSGSYNGIADTCDFRNNVIYNWGINNVYGGEGGFYNVVKNYYKPGPSTTSRNTQFVGVDYSTTSPPHNYAKYYLTGNFITSSATNSASNWKGVTMKSGLMSDTVLSKMNTPLNLPILASETTAAQAYIDVLAGAGARLPNRDTLDQRIVNNVKNGTGRLIDVQGGFPHGTAYALTVNAWPTLDSTTPPVDTDHDGMPDAYETANGLNPNNAADRNNRNADGYTALEVYINSITADTGTNSNPTPPPPTNQADVTATWTLLANQNPTVTGNITATNQELGSAITGILYNSTYGTSGSTHNTGYQRAGSSTFPITSPDLTNGYIQYKVSPVTGKDLKITKISLSALGGATSGVSLVVKYSLDGFATSAFMPVSATYNALNYTATTSNPASLLNGSSTAVDFSGNQILTFNGLSIVVPNGSTFSLRIYAYAAASGKYLASKDVTITGITADAGTLPLSLLSFSGKADVLGKSVNLNWSSTNEINTLRFEVERSIDGKVFNKIGEVKTKNIAGLHHYSFTDHSPSNGLAYYRLKQIDQNGQFTFSDIVFIDIKNKQSLNIYPNPVKDGFTVNHEVAKLGANLKIIGLDGQLKIQRPSIFGAQVDDIETKELKPGYYILTFDNAGEKKSLVFIKQQ
jgi:hypothetical protein